MTNFKSISHLPLFEEFLNQTTVDPEFNLFQYFDKEIRIDSDRSNALNGYLSNFISPDQIKNKSNFINSTEVPLPPGKYFIKGNDNEFIQLLAPKQSEEQIIQQCYFVSTQEFEQIKDEVWIKKTIAGQTVY